MKKNWSNNKSLAAADASANERVEETLFKIRASAACRSYTHQALEGASRVVQGNRGNVRVRYTSAKLGHEVFLESRRGEWPLAVLADADPKVIAFFAQPPAISLEIKDADGNVKTKTRYTPDMLLITETEVIAQQVRDLTALSDACLKNPFQFYLDHGDQRWHYRAADEAFAEMGIRHAIIDNSSIPSALVRNIRFLEEYAKSDAPPLDAKKAQDIANFVKDQRFVEMRALLDAGFDSDDIYKAMLGKHVYVDLTKQLIDATSELVVYSDQATFEAHALVSNAALERPTPVAGQAWIRVGGLLTYQKVNYHVVLVGERDVLVRTEAGIETTLPLTALRNLHKSGDLQTDALMSKSDVRQLADFSEKEIERATKRLKALENPESSGYSKSQLAFFRRKTMHCRNPLERLIALVDRQSDRGNFAPRLSDESIALMSHAIEERYNTPTMPTKGATYLTYKKMCSEYVNAQGNPDPQAPASLGRFCRQCRELEDVGKRQGKKMRYQKQRIVTSLDNAYPVHGVRPYEVLHIDHTVATIATISPNGVDLGKPTLSIGLDPASMSTKAMISSYDPPSAKLVLLLLRDYVRRNGRLPRTLVLDNGKEFHSAELAFFCNIFNIEIRYRAPGMPRGGSPVEREFLTIEEGFIAQLPGNTRQLRDPRLVTDAVNPFNHATWTLTAFHRALEKYLFEIRPHDVSPALGMTPAEYEAKRMHETGLREHMLVNYDENLMLMTCPHPHRRLHIVDPQRGVWVGGMWFNHPAFRDVPKKTKVEVRLEPWLHRVVYACIGGRWVAATASNARWLGNRTRREVEVTLREEKRKGGQSAAQDALSLQQAKALEQVREPTAFDPRLVAQQNEMVHLFQQYGLTIAMPQVVPETIDAQATSTVVAAPSSGPIFIPNTGANTVAPPEFDSFDPQPPADPDGFDAAGFV